MSYERDSTLIIEAERALQPESDEYISREMRVYSRKPDGSDVVSFRKGYNLAHADLGGTIAFVQLYREGMHNDLGVDTVIEIDGGPVINIPLVLEHTMSNLIGFTITGLASDQDRLAPDRSSESIML